jgi:ribosomal protein S18 acetylase RimI-like enzyme
MQPTIEAVDIRDHLRVGDIGEIARLHGTLYHAERGHGLAFEALVAAGLAEFFQQYDAARDRVWICENNEQIVGSLFLMHRPEGAQLRFFLLHPDYRGIGLGELLMSQFAEALEACAYRHAFLWTTRELEAAAALYRRHGFELVEERWSTRFGRGLFEQKFEWSAADGGGDED